jgi:subfamily B ATP-binding cassette protein MsbA
LNETTASPAAAGPASTPAETTVAAAPTGEKSMLSFIVELLRPYRGKLIIVFIAMLVETAMALAGPWPVKVIIDNVLGGHRLPEALAWVHDIGLSQHKAGFALLAGLAVVVIAVIGAIASYIDNYYTESVGQWVANDLRVRVYEHLHRLSLAYYDSQQTGPLLSTLTSDVSTVQDFASSSTLDMLIDVLTIVGMVSLMFWLNWDFALIAIGVTPFLLLFVSRLNKVVKKVTREVRKRQSDIVAVVQQGLESVRVVKAFGRQDLESARLADASKATVDAALKARRVKSLLSPAVTIVVAFCTGFVLWHGTGLIEAGTMTIGGLTVFLAYLAKFFKPVQDLAKMTNTIAQTSVGMERIRRILDADAVIPEKENARDLTSCRGEIAFEHVAFAYRPTEPVLRDVNFTIKPGQSIGICGTTGGGKSTVVSLVPRFYDPTGGSVKLDGVDLRDLKLDTLRRNIGFVLQDTVLFHGTVRENIAYGRPDATPEDIVEAARLANCNEFIDRMPDGYETVVGERGLTMSGGQRQRIGIARALIRNTPILILDEPTAALDTESERLVMAGLEQLMKGRTTITIAHRLSTIRGSDMIIVLKDGMVAEQGTHDELLAKNGVYADLYHVQIGDAPTPPGH